ncbi:MAG: hypothetical protein HYX80_01815 [Chloroflexi bacterium]|nr:hypothetical protein [Chloroflexota bacterium]
MAQYADIVEIVAPAQAAAGELVNVTVRIKNLYSSPVGIKVVGVPEYAGLPPGTYIDFPVENANVNPGETFSFYGSFTMPGGRVTIHAYSYWYGADSLWHFDDEMTKTVELAAAPQPAISDFRIMDYIKV